MRARLGARFTPRINTERQLWRAQYADPSVSTHSIGSTALGIPETILLPGKYVTLTFTPKKVGTYELHCALPCGPGHPDMKLIVKVVE